MLTDLTLGYPTWLFLPSWAMKTVVPFPRGDYIVVLYALVGLGKTRYEPNYIGPRLEVLP